MRSDCGYEEFYEESSRLAPDWQDRMEQRDCRRYQSSMRVRYVAGESGVAIFALVAEKSRARNSLVQQWAPRGV